MNKLLLIFILSITFFSCRKDDFVEQNVKDDNKKYVTDSTIVITPYKEDSIIDKVGCYYPIFEKDYK